MAVYVFSLLVGYYPGGIDYAQGTRSKYLKKLSQPVKYVYTGIPTEREVQQYHQMGIELEDMISAHFLLCGNEGIGGIPYITNKPYYSKGRRVIVEHYTDRLLYTDYYTSVDNNGKQETKLLKKTFRKEDGTVAFDIIYDEKENERYLFPNGENLSKHEFLCKFIQSLCLTEDDIVLIDRGSQSEFVQPLFTYGNRAKIIVFLHSKHYAEEGEATNILYLNFAYYNWFKYTHRLHTIMVSTNAQKAELIEKLKDYECQIPNVEAVPVSGLDILRYPTENRKPYSLLTASRLVPRKKIDWVIRSVIKAHEICPDVSLDIYGEGSDAYMQFLNQIVENNHAENYIRFMGHCDIKERYTGYEAYVSASLGETFGLSLLEAAGSGNALIGLNVKYGNDIFIQKGKNGYLTDIDYKQIENEEYVNGIIQNIAVNIIRLFWNPVRLEAYQKESYKIAEKYLDSVIGEQWIRLFERIIAERK